MKDLLLLCLLFWSSGFQTSTCHIAPLRRWYISEKGTDSDQCGKLMEFPCRTLKSVVRRVQTTTEFVNPVLLDQVGEVWRKMSGQLQNTFNFLNRTIYGNNPPVPMLPTTHNYEHPWITKHSTVAPNPNTTSNLGIMPNNGSMPIPIPIPPIPPTPPIPSIPNQSTTSSERMLNKTKNAWNTTRTTSTNLAYTTPLPIHPTYGFVALCEVNGQVNHSIIDDPCHRIKTIYLSHILAHEERIHFTKELDNYCIARRNLFAVRFQSFCEYINRYTLHFETVEEYYQKAQTFIDVTHYQMISDLRLVNVEIATDTDLEMTNEIQNTDEQIYLDYTWYVHIVPGTNNAIHADIVNNTFYKLHWYLDNCRISANIKDNVFKEAGIKISSKTTDTYQLVVIENNIFQGKTSKTIVEVLNTKNVIFSTNVFENLKYSEEDSVTDDSIPGILCRTSHIQMHNTLLQNVTFSPIFVFDNCTLIVNNLTMVENNLGAFGSPSNAFGKQSMVYIRDSKGTMENSMFLNNNRVNCLWVTGGDVTFHKLTATGNNEVQVGRILDAVVNITSSNVRTNNGSLFHITHSVASIYSSTFKYNSDDNDLFTFSDSKISIFNCVLADNKGKSLILQETKSKLFIAGSSFLFNWFPIRTSLPIETLGSVVGSVVIYDTVFFNNDLVAILVGVSAEFTNCIFNRNYYQVIFVFVGSLQLNNCSFWNNTSKNSPIVEVGFSSATLLNCNLTNNTALGVNENSRILSSTSSSLLVQESVFENNSCAVEGGAIRARRNSTLEIVHSVFKNNTALGTDGGAIILEAQSQLISQSCQFIGNIAALGGGAIMVIDHSSYSDTGSTFTNNIAGDNGGAISVHDHSTITSRSTSFNGNQAGSKSTSFNGNQAGSKTHCTQGLAYENDGGAVMLETYSHATLIDCSFKQNRARDSGGAIYCRRRSHIFISDSNFQFNKAGTSGGSIMVQHSWVTIKASSFENEIAAVGFGGSISADHVGNVTIDSCVFVNCTASYGGSISIRIDSILITNYSVFNLSFSTAGGGALHIDDRSFMFGYKIEIKHCESTSGAGIAVGMSSKITLGEIYFTENIGTEGGSVYCMKSDMIIDKGKMNLNYAKSSGGAVFSKYCQLIFDNVTFVNSTAEVYGGAIKTESSNIDIHNCKAEGNAASSKGKFAMISSQSKLKASHLIFINVESHLMVITGKSKAELEHIYMSDINYYCPIRAMDKSHINLLTLYSQDAIVKDNRHKPRQDVCVDISSSVEGPTPGKFPESCKRKCQCYSNRHQNALVVDCSHSGLTDIPDSLPERIDWLLLSGNNVTSLSIQQTEVLNHVYKLDMNTNKLENISLHFLDLITESNNLLYLDLSKNHLKTLPDGIRNLSSLTTLKLSGNKFKCSCDNIWIKDWLLNETDLIEDYENVLCQMTSGKWIPIVKMDKADMGCIPSEAFSTWKIVVISLSGILIAIVVAIIAKKWDIIKFWLFLKFGIKFKDKVEVVKNIASLDYDAFINYNVNDHQWVREHITRLLEDHNYKLCLHIRDFVPTATIPHNINLAIKHSRRMISVVTRNYLESGWCKEEFSQGHLEAVEGRYRFIILIMLEDIDVNDLPDEMQKYVKTYTYIDATKLNNDKEVDLFEKKLLYVMPKKPIREFNIEKNDDYNYNVPPLFNREFKYRDHMARFDRP